jgi:hypothetical protein
MMELPSREEAAHSTSVYVPYCRIGADRRILLCCKTFVKCLALFAHVAAILNNMVTNPTL